MSSTPPRIRDFSLTPGLLPVGPQNLLSDVAGVRVGHRTIRRDGRIATGVTVIDPGTPNLFRQKLPAAIAVGNGFGKMVGSTQIEELGTLETPIALTNTLAVGPVMRGLVDLTIRNTPDLAPHETINAVVGETNDGLLNAIHELAVTGDDVIAAFDQRSADFALGCVGAGTGTRAFSWKGGIGSSSRLVRINDNTYTIGVLVQTNFGGALTIMGVPVGERLGKTDFDTFRHKPDGSCMIVLATDAPLDSRQLKRLARRSLLGMVRTGSIMAHGSGDYAIGFTTNTTSRILSDDDLNACFLAATEAAEESIYDALLTATTTEGRDGYVMEQLPVEEVMSLVRERVS